MTNHQKRRAQLLLADARNEEDLLKRPNLSQEARRLISASINRKLATVQTLRTGARSVKVTNGIEHATEIYR